MTDDTANSPATFTRSHRGDPMTPVPADAAMNALSADEERTVRDFYERRTTRLAMGPSVLIPRLLATLDAARQSRTTFRFPDGTVGPGRWDSAKGEVVPDAARDVDRLRCGQCGDEVLPAEIEGHLASEGRAARESDRGLRAALLNWYDTTHGDGFGHDHHCPLRDQTDEGDDCTCGWSAVHKADRLRGNT